MTEAWFELDQIRVKLPDERTITWPHVELHATEIVSIVAPSGSGKTSIFYALSGLLQAPFECSGTMRLDKARIDISTLNSPLAGLNLALQGKHLFNPLKRIQNQVRGDLDKLIANLSVLGISEPSTFIRKFPNELSGGEKQRFLLAEAFTESAKICLLDEPTFGLDDQNIDRLKHFFKQQSKAILLITHDVLFAKTVSDRIFEIKDGVVQVAKPNTNPSLLRKLQAPLDKTVAHLSNVAFQYTSRKLFSNQTFSIDIESFELKQGEIRGVYGPSGSGKTTLLRVLGGLEKPSKGKVEVKGRTFTIFQDAVSSFDPALTMQKSFSILGIDIKVIDVDAFNLKKEQWNQKPMELSGGECQRFALIRALHVGFDILLMDEPFSGLDDANCSHLVEVLTGLIPEKSIVLVSHQIDKLNQCCHQTSPMHLFLEA